MICFPLDNTDYKADALGAWCGTRTRGVFAADEHYKVTTGGNMSVTVSPGLAWLKAGPLWGVTAYETSNQILSLAAADGALERIDAVCVRLNKTLNVGEIVIKKGSYTPQPATIAAPARNDSFDEIYVATVRVRAGSTAILATDITDQRLNPAYCGIMSDGITNVNSGGNSKMYPETSTSTQTRTIIIPDVTTWADLYGLVLHVKAAAQGEAQVTTLDVKGNGVNLGAQKIYFPGSKSGELVNTPPQYWVKKGGVYIVTWTGENLVCLNSQVLNSHYADFAESAMNAETAEYASNANRANSAASATSADSAYSAVTASTATNANALGGYAPTAYPRLAATNTFTAQQIINANLACSGTASLFTLNVSPNAITVGGFTLGGGLAGTAGIIGVPEIAFTGTSGVYNITRNSAQIQFRFSSHAFLTNAGAYAPVYGASFTNPSSMGVKKIVNETVPESLLDALLEADVFQFEYKTKNLVTAKTLQSAYDADFKDEGVAHLFEVGPLAYQILDLETHHYPEEAAELEAELPDRPLLKDGKTQYEQRTIEIAKAVGETDPKKIAEAAFIAEQLFTGCSAEAMAKIYPACVSFDTETGKPVGIDYSKLTSPLLVLVQMLYKRLLILEQNDIEKESRMQEMQKQLNDFEARLAALEKK